MQRKVGRSCREARHEPGTHEARVLAAIVVGGRRRSNASRSVRESSRASRGEALVPTDAGRKVAEANGCVRFALSIQRTRIHLGPRRRGLPRRRKASWFERALALTGARGDGPGRASRTSRAGANPPGAAASRLEPVGRCLQATEDVRRRKGSVKAPPAAKNGAGGPHRRYRRGIAVTARFGRDLADCAPGQCAEFESTEAGERLTTAPTILTPGSANCAGATMAPTRRDDA